MLPLDQLDARSHSRGTHLVGAVLRLCCFSMRFIVMIDLISTLTQPDAVAYVSFTLSC